MTSDAIHRRTAPVGILLGLDFPVAIGMSGSDSVEVSRLTASGPRASDIDRSRSGDDR